jgi:protein tyrosine phosphatase (PTP) superfamily phosphohydrolase (DUF442 family)
VLIGLLAFIVGGNALIVGASLVIGWLAPPPRPAVDVAGVGNLAVVDARVWRSAAPSLDGYRSLAAAGVTTVVDLRAEPGTLAEDGPIRALGLDVIHIPMRDGQPPNGAQVAQFLGVVAQAKGTVLVHCAAGVGRTGSMVAAYLVATGQTGSLRATLRNLAVGPPSLEQLAFTLGLWGTHVNDAPLPIVVASRVLDAPRRIWSSWG